MHDDVILLVQTIYTPKDRQVSFVFDILLTHYTGSGAQTIKSRKSICHHIKFRISSVQKV